MARPRTETDIEQTFAGRIGAEITRRREKKKLTVAEVAQRAGVPAATWYHWERGRHLPLGSLPAVAAAIGCRVRLLLPDE